jgi:hypothetical protein
MRHLLAVLLLLPLLLAAQAKPPLGGQSHPPGYGAPGPPAVGGQATEVTPSTQFIAAPPPASVPPPQATLAYSIVIDNRTGGIIRVVDPPAQFLLARPGTDIGTVLRPATELNSESFHASLWGQPMTVVASAVNAVHIKAYNEAAAPRAAVITLLPADLIHSDLAGVPSQPRNDSIYTDIPGGRGIFGGAWPVLTGNRVSVYRDTKHILFEGLADTIKVGDIIIIEVRTPEQWPQSLVFDNHEGGTVVLAGADGTRTICATISKPVTGTGRFSGGVFCNPGGIRATHSGVLDLDFSPFGETGGLQFIPYAHSLSPEMSYSQDSPPYGILLGPDGNDLRGQAPLFAGYLYPQSGLEAPAKLPRLNLSVQFGMSSLWMPVPEMVGLQQFVDLSAIRIDWQPQTPVDAPKPDTALAPDSPAPL